MTLLEGHGLSKSFGGVRALSDVDFEIAKGTVVGLIGPNGAGKTTLFNIVAGSFKPTAGRVLFDGQDISGLPADKICRRGIARTFQVTRPFGDMTCRENVMVAAINHRAQRSRVEIEQIADEKLDLVGLGEHALLAAKNLNVIQKKRLEIARALATGPKLLMLDEVLGGLNTQEIIQAIEFIRLLRDEFGLTVFWIEHVMGAIMEATDRVIVLEQGKILMTGTPHETAGDPRVIQAYLGE
ncbi:MAG: ABC transporter ATP-binding protein [Deltaproteobacteria bacterium]|nr:ABC transporter ATP-binding protein [Deltaproteobacteria bacterium]